RTYYHYFQIQEFRRPEFEVTARNETTGPYFVGGSATVATTAEYFAGGPLPNAEVNWLVQASPSSYQPPNWPGFVFGSWTPWWYYDYFYAAPAYEEDVYYGGPVYEESRVQTFSGVTDASGTHYLQIDFEAMSRPQPFSVMAEATVFDVNRQAWTGATSLLVHPADLYVGLHSDQTFVKKGTPLEIQAIVTDLDGNAVAGRPIEIRAARLEWRYRQGSWGEVEADVQFCAVESTTEPVLCTFDTPNGGEYRITATIQDESGRENMSEFTRWVSGGNRPVSRNIEQEQLLLIPDKDEYQPGDTAQILVQAPFYPAEGLLTVSRNGILYTERFQIGEDGTATLQIPIAEEHVPNLELQVDLAGSAPRTDDEGQPRPDLPARPAYASGNLSLRIPPLSRTLTVSASPQASALAPGESTAVDVTVLDANGQPVPDAELLLVVVDEAILGLSNYQLLDPINIFYPNRWGGTQTVYGRQSIILANPEQLAPEVTATPMAFPTSVALQSAGGEDTASFATEGEMVMEEAEMAYDADMADEFGAAAAPSTNDGSAPPIAVRTDFNPLATFAPAVRTDSSGQATVEVSLPDNLTRYRVMVVAVAGGQQYGTSEANLTARLPLMVRPSAPRFLNFGDQVEFPVVLQNQTDEPLVVDVVLATTNLEMTGPAGFRVDVPANNRVEVRFPATTVGVGTARYQVAAVSGDYADAASGSLPVYTPATTEAFATYGVLDGGAVAQPLAYPEGVYPQFGGLEISTSSTALQALTDAVLYLSSYRYEGSEQLASRILGIAALRDVLDAFEAEGLPSPA
ncbi:MAG: hypothetical protein KDE28_20805, partial [Anaerolineales bacterium]|nr:hypothetical protein [Anaerolineales bacterium]